MTSTHRPRDARPPLAVLARPALLGRAVIALALVLAALVLVALVLVALAGGFGRRLLPR